jgi:hypothetical protein
MLGQSLAANDLFGNMFTYPLVPILVALLFASPLASTALESGVPDTEPPPRDPFVSTRRLAGPWRAMTSSEFPLKPFTAEESNRGDVS